jgi:ABC-type xylose transport system permease subunit
MNRLLDTTFSNRGPLWLRVTGMIVCYAVILLLAAVLASITGLPQWLTVMAVTFVFGVWLGVAQWRRTGRFPFRVTP